MEFKRKRERSQGRLNFIYIPGGSVIWNEGGVRTFVSDGGLRIVGVDHSVSRRGGPICQKGPMGVAVAVPCHLDAVSPTALCRLPLAVTLLAAHTDALHPRTALMTVEASPRSPAPW